MSELIDQASAFKQKSVIAAFLAGLISPIMSGMKLVAGVQGVKDTLFS